MTDDPKISAGMLNSLFNKKLDSDADKVTHELQVYLEERMRYHDLKVTDVLVTKVADQITISFKIGDGHVRKSHTSVWQEQELLSLPKPITTILDEELKTAIEEFKATIYFRETSS